MPNEAQNGDTSLPLIIVNPHSAGGSTREKWAGMASDIRAHFGPFSVAFTKGPGDAANIAERAANSGRKFIIACGGDGTVNETANGILRSCKDVEFGIIPSGTGGDFRRSLGLPMSTREAAAALRNGVTRRIDVGKVSYTAHDGRDAERYFLNVSSVGLAASILERVRASKAASWLPIERIRGPVNYAVSTLQEIADPQPFNVRVSFDGGEPHVIRSIALCIANARYFGGGMMIAPEARLNDGLLDVVNIGDLGTARILLNSYTLYRGTHLGLSEVGSTLARRIYVEASDGSEIHIETDGELPGRLPAIYEIIPGALKVRVPK
jgi:YegS/Rv2252/BmrU family lipid kinase